MMRPWTRTGSTRPRRLDNWKARTLAWSAPVEVLEARRLMSVYTDVSQVAALTAPHSGATNLYINFDGGTVPQDPVNNPNGPSTSKKVVRPFEEEAGDGGLNRDQDIQEILFQVAQVYAPFNVEVHRIYGAGNYGTGNGDTTVFVGAIESNSTQSGPAFNKYTYSFTPAASLDNPTSSHTINSDNYNVAFMDPVTGSTYNPAATYSCQGIERNSAGTDANIFDITRSIDHESGHTFGLSHVRTDGLTDPSALKSGSVNDIMSYDSSNVYFADQSLTLTTANYNGTSTTFSGTLPSYLATKNINLGIITVPLPYSQNLSTQNSYLTLLDTLGARPEDEYCNVANVGLVDPVYTLLGVLGMGAGAAPKVDLSHTTTQYGVLGRYGDDHVFTITPSVTPVPGTITEEHITVRGFGGGLAPELLIYDSTGTNFIGSADPIGGVASYSLPNGSSYQVVVASQDGDSTGLYEMQLGALSLPIIHYTPISLIALTTSVPSITMTTTTNSTSTTTGLGAEDFVPLAVSVPSISVLTEPKSELDLD